MTTTSTLPEPSAAAILSLLDRLDPAVGICAVPGCVHHHPAAGDTPWRGALAA